MNVRKTNQKPVFLRELILLATLGAAYGPIGNPAGHIARWRAAMVRQAPRLCAPGAVVGLVCALGAISGSIQCAWRCGVRIMIPDVPGSRYLVTL